ncbi:reverse transcriptase domain-containing protein [Marinobacter sp. OP 3.4]|uniref:reverse transcriptase domain-containing protein n=1 Tax=Marinobacter sp. OP 3.4 TaxID=3076501 RepID=UPI002E24079F
MNTIKKDFENSFSKENLLLIYNEEISGSRSTGVDNISTKTFETDLENNIIAARNRVLNGKYQFTRYKQKLISKGENKTPREVCIPTIRDRLILKALNQFLQKRLSDKIEQPLPQSITKKIKASINDNPYDWVVKLDVADFYPSIRHEILNRNLRKFIRHGPALRLIEKAIEQSTKKSRKNELGIPQGLPISNILAALYLRNVDKHFQEKDNFFYQRYVDDVLILCSSKDAQDISENVIKRCKNIGLQVYDPQKRPDKSLSVPITNEFSYLGYRYNPTENLKALATTSKASKQKLIDSLVGLFTAYQNSKRKSLGLLQWKVNLRITGCISENKGRGWLFFFSEIDDQKTLFHLDNIVKSLCNHFNVSIELKRFARAWHEINHNRWRNKYFPNFDKYDVNEMALIVATHQGVKPEDLDISDEEIKATFWTIVRKEIREMDADIQPFS